jgi:prepilin-type N-terminal cleavage/methylation domain-containing protein
MTQNLSRPRAFSLIEISIVILVIGLIVAGIAQAGKMMRKAAITSARSSTKNSPAIFIDGLTLWLDTVSERSFLATETDDGTAVTNWTDLVPTEGNLKGRNATQATSSNQPKYTTKGPGNLPVLTFDGSDYLTLANGMAPTGNSAYTVFFAAQADANGGLLLGTGTAPNNTWFRYGTSGNFEIEGGSGKGGTITVGTNGADKFQVISATYDGTTSTTSSNNVYVNGAQATISTVGGSPTSRQQKRC